MNESDMPARATETTLLGVADARRSPSYGSALRLDQGRFGGPLEHAGVIHTF